MPVGLTYKFPPVIALPGTAFATKLNVVLFDTVDTVHEPFGAFVPVANTNAISLPINNPCGIDVETVIILPLNVVLETPIIALLKIFAANADVTFAVKILAAEPVYSCLP
jgi:hypothetical protein